MSHPLKKQLILQSVSALTREVIGQPGFGARLRLRRLPYFVAAIFCAAISVTGQQSAPAQAGGVISGESRFRVIRSVSGTHGHAEGPRYIIEEPRNAFHPPDDSKIIVYFEWDGPPGDHHIEGWWKNPSAK